MEDEDFFFSWGSLALRGGRTCWWVVLGVGEGGVAADRALGGGGGGVGGAEVGEITEVASRGGSGWAFVVDAMLLLTLCLLLREGWKRAARALRWRFAAEEGVLQLATAVAPGAPVVPMGFFPTADSGTDSRADASANS